MEDAPPLLLTLALAPAAAAVFEAERRRHFPPARNQVPAHVSLFHHLPGAALDGILGDVQSAAADTPAFTVTVDAPVSLGRGVAYRLSSPVLLRLRARLAAVWRDWLTPQDRQGFRPHVTIQNKVTPEAARVLHATLLSRFMPYAVPAIGLDLWWYRGGPWELCRHVPLAAAPPGQEPGAIATP